MIGQHIADGLLTGSIIALGAIGLSFSMRILRFANFSHSELLTVGAYSGFTFLTLFAPLAAITGSFGALSFGPPLLLAMLCACAFTSLVALGLDSLVFKRLRNRAGHMTLVFASFGIALLVRNLVLLGYGPDPLYYNRSLQMAIRLPGGIRVLPDQIFVFGLTIVIVIGLHVFLTRTRTGIAMRAVAENPSLAEVSGVDVDTIIRWTWIIGASGAAIAGVMYGLTVQIRPELGFSLILPLFAAAILGGTGSMYGAVLGGLFVGLAENLSIMVIPSTYKPAVPFLLLVAVLYLRPQGFFGDRQ